jgi:hypothetical protein
MSKIYSKTRRAYSYEYKRDILKRLDRSHNNVATFAKAINIPVRTLQDWNNERDQIFTIDKKELRNKKIGSGDKPVLTHGIEMLILDWLMAIQLMGVPITDEIIIGRAQFLKDLMKLPIECTFTNGWLEKFKNRHHIVRRKAGSKNIKKAERVPMDNFLKLVNEKISSNKYFSIINIDETPLYYDPTINFTLAVKGTKRIEIKTTGREKQRITAILGIDLLNNIKVKPFIIFKGKTNRCLNGIPLSASYNLSYQKNSWCTDAQFIKYLSSLPKDKNILLLYDNFRGHKTKKVTDFLETQLPLVEVLLLPPHTTPFLQPLDVGINKPFKAYINKKYIHWLIETVDNNKEFPRLEKKDRNILLINWIFESWNNINDNMIKNSFHHCGYSIAGNVDPKWKQFVASQGDT